MNSTRLIAVVLMAACLLAGWIVGSGGQATHAQETTEPETVTETEEPERDCRFEIPYYHASKAIILLDQCTGSSWWFDDGYDYSSNSYVGSRTWRTIEVE